MRWSSIRSPRKRAWLLVLVAGLMAWTGLAAGLDNGHLGVFQDDGLYLTSARSLRDGRGFGLPSRPGEPPPKYPIGLPATIALALRLDPGPASVAREIAVGRGVVLAGALVFFLAAHAWLRRLGVGPGMACGVVLATAFHHVVLIGGATTIFADLPFAAVAFVLIGRWASRAGAPESGTARRAFWDGMIAGFGVLLRSNGVTLAAAALVAAAVGPRRRSGLIACLAGLALAVVPATEYAGRHPRIVPSNSYLLEMKAGWSSVDSGLKILGANATSMVLEFPARVLASPATYSPMIIHAMSAHPWASVAFRGGLSILVLAGLVSLARSSRRVDLPAWTHAAGSMAVFAVWPWNGIMDRFLLSLIPMVILAFARGIESTAGALGLGPKAGRRLAAAGLAAVALGNAGVVTRAAIHFHASGGQWPGASRRASLDRALALVRDRTEPDAVIAAFWPELVHLHAGRMVVPLVEDEAVLLGRFGDIARLRLWRSTVPGRPFYLLVRGEEEDLPGSDLAQAAALGAEPGTTLREAARTPDGRYRLVRVDSDSKANAAHAMRSATRPSLP